MAKVFILRGISGSGKSTVAKAICATRGMCLTVNRDSIRAMLFGSEDAYGVDEQLVSLVEKDTLVSMLRMGYDVVIDNTHVRWEYVEDVAATAQAVSRGIEIEVIIVNTPLEEALRRNANRDRQVPEHVIRNQYRLLEESKDKTLEGTN